MRSASAAAMMRRAQRQGQAHRNEVLGALKSACQLGGGNEGRSWGGAWGGTRRAPQPPVERCPAPSPLPRFPPFRRHRPAWRRAGHPRRTPWPTAARGSPSWGRLAWRVPCRRARTRKSGRGSGGEYGCAGRRAHSRTGVPPEAKRNRRAHTRARALAAQRSARRGHRVAGRVRRDARAPAPPGAPLARVNGAARELEDAQPALGRRGGRAEEG